MTAEQMIMVTITWERRADGIVPKPSHFASAIIRDECPKLLVDFYESRINLKGKRND
jgi:hypothetical protein